MGKMTVDVVIPTYNNAPYLEACLESVFSQSVSPERILVVDDNSSDDTAEVLARLAADERVTVISNTVNKGPSASRNLAISEASADLVAFLDGDDAWMPEKLALQVAQFERFEDLGLCFTGLVDCDEEFTPIADPRPVEEFSGKRVFEELFMSRFSIATSTVMVRRAALDRCGLFNEEMRKTEDYELWLRIAMLYTLSAIDENCCQRRVHSNSLLANTDYDEKLKWEFFAFDECAAFAEKNGVALPMAVPLRKGFSVERRVKKSMGWGDIEGGRHYFNLLGEYRDIGILEKVMFSLDCLAISTKKRVGRALKAVIC
ncbi:MAG: hypothetical protein C0609_06435 [Deltaproteobacteria bacterium]|nr:MAG: hypothetical protein C0609_06435 [Deltaproteobacteria bacterium]